MSRRAAIVEEFDDDTELPLPSHSLPGHRIVDSDDGGGDSDDAPELLNHTTSGSPALKPDAREGRVTDITPYKMWTCVYPIYIDAKRPYGTGARRISRTKINKMHPSDWENPGRVRVQWKKDGRPVNSNIRTKKQLLETISFQIQRVKADNVPSEPYTYPTPAPPPAAKPAKSKASTGKSAAGAQVPKLPTGRSLPSPPDPQPALKSRVSAYSPAVPSGVLIDTVRAGMSATEGQGAIGG
ncbi:signal recognition particle, SRP19 subunit, partial [Lactarius tabidus]